jgi:hypothetical protein
MAAVVAPIVLRNSRLVCIRMTIAFLLADGFLLCVFSRSIEQVGINNTAISGPLPVHFMDASGEIALHLSVRYDMLMSNWPRV